MSGRVHCANPAPLPPKTATSGSPYFVLTAANGEIIGTSELYSTAAVRDNGLGAVMKTPPGAPLVDNTQ